MYLLSAEPSPSDYTLIFIIGPYLKANLTSIKYASGFAFEKNTVFDGFAVMSHQCRIQHVCRHHALSLSAPQIIL